jgi:hypothetical protein
MITVVGVFAHRAGAERAVHDLRTLGIDDERVDFLLPALPRKQLSEVLTADSEQPGMGRAMGTVVGGALGVAAGMSLGTAAASFLVPGIGPVLGLGSLAAAVLGLIGAAGGGTAGRGLDRALMDGLPKDELYLYEDALRQGRSVVICLAQNQIERDEARQVLEREGAETIDAARHKWWTGLRDAEREHYTASGADFTKDENPFHSGFEAALNPEFRGKPWDQVVYLLAEQYRDWSADSFRKGFERGQRHYQSLLEQHQPV